MTSQLVPKGSRINNWAVKVLRIHHACTVVVCTSWYYYSYYGIWNLWIISEVMAKNSGCGQESKNLTRKKVGPVDPIERINFSWIYFPCFLFPIVIFVAYTGQPARHCKPAFLIMYATTNPSLCVCVWPFVGLFLVSSFGLDVSLILDVTWHPCNSGSSNTEDLACYT